MVLIRPRLKKMTVALDTEEASGGQQKAQTRAHLESRRRAVLYNVSSPSGKRLPSVSLQPSDARIRRDLLRLTQQYDERVVNDKKLSEYEAELNDCKHREHLCYRPPMDHIQKLRDLHTTVAKDCRGHVKLTAEERMFAKLQNKSVNNIQDDTKPEWRLGYSNNVDTGSRAGVARTFEPRSGARERVLDTPNSSTLTSDSAAIAYPVQKADIQANLVWQSREDADNQVEGERKRIHRDHHHHVTIKKKPWCPASVGLLTKSSSSTNSRRRYQVERFTPDVEDDSSPDTNSYDLDGLQRFPIRSADSFDHIDEAEEYFAIDARCAGRQSSLLTKVVDKYTQIRARIDRMKDPQLRYELPVENEEHPRAYRLGLEPAPSTHPKRLKKAKFRPKSAGTALGFQTTTQGPKSGDLLTPDSNRVSKVAGATRRPHSASITYFKQSTVFCMGPPTPSESNCVSAATDFKSVVTIECQKRQREREAILRKLSTRGLLHTTPLAQVFARLRREALLNVERRLKRSSFERMTMEEYMSACGCIHNSVPTPVTSTDRKHHSDTPIASSMKEARRFSVNSTNNRNPSEDISPSLLATRSALIVSRQQFHLALEAFNLSSSDVNRFFSALDVTVSDSVQIWDVICAVETMQHEHTALRRARVQQLQAPTKDLDFFRRQSTRSMTENKKERGK